MKITAGYDNSDSEKIVATPYLNTKSKKNTIHSPDCWMRLNAAHVNFVRSTPIRIHM
ncbi:MAG: hypothetical protein WAM26_17035 [Nitrososphaeraceae archaeon]